jgi:hypothetical protein
MLVVEAVEIMLVLLLADQVVAVMAELVVQDPQALLIAVVVEEEDLDLVLVAQVALVSSLSNSTHENKYEIIG